MTVGARGRSAKLAPPAAAAPRSTVGPRVSLLALLLGAAAISVANLWQDWYIDPYFAAAVKSMLTSWHNFFFVSFDPAGFIAVDKPPLALWLQAASARLLGFTAFSLLLPQALAGVLAVAVLYHLVARVYGHTAGLLAGLFLALTPIDVAMNRSNNGDGLLVLVVLVAAWATSRAAETGRLGPLLLAAATLGLGFNVKWLQAFLVAPAFGVLYLLTPGAPWRARCGRLAVAAGVLVVVSLAWVTAVDLTPAGQRPFVGSSSHNTELDLALGYGGLSRLAPGSTVATAVAGPVGNGPGDPGPLRLFDAQLGGQVSWLLPLALAGLVAAVRSLAPVPPPMRRGPRMPSALEAPARSALLERRRQSVLLWGTWLVSNVLVFSIADFFHPYNLVILAPAICALAAISIVVLWDDYNRAGGVGWAFPAALVTTALIQAGIIAESPPWLPWLPALVVGSAIVAAMVLLLTGGTSSPQRGTARAAARAGCLSVLLAPILWASVPVWHYGNAELPVAGPDLFSAAVEPPARTMAFIAPPTFTRFLLAHHHHERFVLAVRYAGVAAPVMLATGKAVLTYGGYLGTDHILNAGGLARLVAAGAVRYFWMLPPSPTGENQDDLDRWVRRWCDRVNQRLWQAPPGYGPAGPLLYRCADTNRRALARTLRG